MSVKFSQKMREDYVGTWNVKKEFKQIWERQL